MRRWTAKLTLIASVRDARQNAGGCHRVTRPPKEQTLLRGLPLVTTRAGRGGSVLQTLAHLSHDGFLYPRQP